MSYPSQELFFTIFEYNSTFRFNQGKMQTEDVNTSQYYKMLRIPRNIGFRGILRSLDYCSFRSRYILIKILCTLSNFAKINEAGIPMVVYINKYANLHNVRIFSDRNYLAYQQLLYAHYHFMQLSSFTSCNFIVWLKFLYVLLLIFETEARITTF